LVLGVLDSEQRRHLQARVDADRTFADRVAYWERRFAPWLSEIEPVEPGPQSVHDGSSSPGEKNPGHAADERQEELCGEHVTHQSQAPRTQRGADSHVVPPPNGVDRRQVAQVDHRNQQDQRHRRHQQRQGSLDRRHEFVFPANDLNAMELCVIRGRDIEEDRTQPIRVCLRRRQAHV